MSTTTTDPRAVNTDCAACVRLQQHIKGMQCNKCRTFAPNGASKARTQAARAYLGR